MSRLANDLTVEDLVRQVSCYAVWALGIIVAASAFGLEPSTLATGLGRSGAGFLPQGYDAAGRDLWSVRSGAARFPTCGSESSTCHGGPKITP